MQSEDVTIHNSQNQESGKLKVNYKKFIKERKGIIKTNEWGIHLNEWGKNIESGQKSGHSAIVQVATNGTEALWNFVHAFQLRSNLLDIFSEFPGKSG